MDGAKQVPERPAPGGPGEDCDVNLFMVPERQRPEWLQDSILKDDRNDGGQSAIALSHDVYHRGKCRVANGPLSTREVMEGPETAALLLSKPMRPLLTPQPVIDETVFLSTM